MCADLFGCDELFKSLIFTMQDIENPDLKISIFEYIDIFIGYGKLAGVPSKPEIIK